MPPDVIPKTPEQRWYPQPGGGLSLVVPFDGGEFDAERYHVVPGFWDHTTYDFCIARAPAMTVCYVTTRDPLIELCSRCYGREVASKSPVGRRLLWRARRWLGTHTAA